MDRLAPIVLFVYNRPDHTRQTVEALQKNHLANESELFIFSDAPKNEDAKQKVTVVREYIKTVNGLKKITIIERKKNWGLANSIIDGVTKIVNEYGKIIVLEDDLVTSPYFLKFMNEALEFYKNEDKVWHVSGWNYPIKKDGLDDVFLWRGMECWGWATWADRWKYYKKDTDFVIAQTSKADIDYLNLDRTRNIWKQVLDNKKGKINTWAVYWYLTIVLNRKLSVNPTLSFVRNIGLDGSGENCGDNDFHNLTLNSKKNTFHISEIENNIAVEKIKNFVKGQKGCLFIRVVNKLNSVLKRR